MTTQCSNHFSRYSFVLAFLLSGTGLAHAQWTKAVTNGTMEATDCILLTDGTVMCQLGETTNTLVRLTPDDTGSYVNGTWSTTNITSLPKTYKPRFFCSVVLADGRVIFTGGEYNGGGSNQSNLGYIFDPTLNGGMGSWTQITPPDNGTGVWTQIGDSPCIVLPDDTFVLGNHSSTQMAAFDAATLTYKDLNPTGKADSNSEEGWTLLPDGTILTVDTEDGTNSEIYDPATNAWSSAGCTGVELAGNAPPRYVPEMGPAVLRGGNGGVIQFGATPNNASYDYTEGLWVTGPSFPIPFSCGGKSYSNAGAADAPASILPNGNVLVAASPVDSTGNEVFCTVFFEFNGGSLTPVPGDPDALVKPTFGLRMLALPSGDVLVTDGSADVEFYNNHNPPSPSWQPTITGAPPSLVPGQTYPIFGTQFNGVSQGAFYGDDGEWATNYPLVRITNNASQKVMYARTHDHSSMGVETGALPVSTYFDVPATLALGDSTLEVVANGIPSIALPIDVVAAGSTPAIAVRSSGEADVAIQGPNNSLIYYHAAVGQPWSASTVAENGTTFSSPSIFVRSTGEADIVAQGPDNSLLYYQATPNNPWSVSTIANSGTTFSAPAIAVRSTGEADVVAQGPRRSLLYYYATPGNPWIASTIAGFGTTFSAPAIAVRSANPAGEADVVAQGPGDSLIYYHAAPGKAWYPVTVAGSGTTFSAPAIAVSSAGEAELVALGAGNSLLFYHATPGQPFSSETIAGPGTTFSAPAIAVRSVDPAGETDVVAQGANNSLNYYHAPSGQAFVSSVVANSGTTFAPPVIAVRQANPEGEADLVTYGAGDTLLYYHATPGSAWFVSTIATF